MSHDDKTETIPYPHFLSPLRIGNITVRNRLMQTAHAKGFHAADGLMSNRDIFYHAERSKGGIGLIVTGTRHVHPSSTGPSRTLARGNRTDIVERDAEMVSVVHAFGGRIIAQLIYFGPQDRSGSQDDDRLLWGPSTMKSPAYNEWAREIAKEEMDEVSEVFAQTAFSSKAAGFDGVELHYSHGYLHQQFSPFVYNKCMDEYGGSLENIVRFPIETIERGRELNVFRKGSEYSINSWVRSIDGNKAQLLNLFTDNDTQILEADTIVMACGHTPVNDLHKELEGRVSRLFCISDAQLPRPLQDFIYEGMLVGREILGSPDRFIEQGALEGFDKSWRQVFL
jgi:hypothetical protein